MATKHQFICGMYESVLGRVTNNPAEWMAFMRSACRNYKCRFDEQILIYAQRPDATAVLEIEKWNRQFGRWVNKNATGIAVFDDNYNGNYRLKHYFDIADTHESQSARPVPIWTMEARYEADVIESLENSFGELEDKSTLEAALISVAKNAVDDNLPDYLHELMQCREDSFLEELDELNVEVAYRTALQNSVAYMLLTRCGIDANTVFDGEDFRRITDFNTLNTVNALGLAAGDITEACLREISATVLNLQNQEKKQNRTFASHEKTPHNMDTSEIQHERSFEDGTDLSDGGRLPRTQPDRALETARNPWQIRIAPKDAPETAPQDIVREPVDVGQTERTPDGGRTDSQREDGAADRADGGGTGRDRTDESRESDAVGRADEQHPAFGGGNGTERPDIRVKPLPAVSEQIALFEKAEETAKATSSAFSISQQIIDEVLTSGSNEQNSTLRIVSYFKKDRSLTENAEFLSREYRTDGKGFIFADNHVSVWFNDSGIHIAAGDTALNANNVSLITWEQAARRIRELLDMGRYMPQSELDKADGVEIKALADSLWYLHQDLADDYEFSFMDTELFKGGFPNSTARIAELLTQPERQQIILDGLIEFVAAYDKNLELLRFPFAAQHLVKSVEILSGLQREPLVFTADESVSTARPGFITQDEVDALLIRGANIQESKFRVYSFFLQNHTAKEKADFLKNEYGTGGSGTTEWHDSKGISFSRENNHMPYDKVILPWSKVARCIDELIADGRYMSERELAYIPEYEKDELAREVVSFYLYQPEDLPRPFPHGTDFLDSVKIVRPQLDEPEHVAETLSQMAAILDNTADFDRNYESMRRAFNNLTAYQNGTFSLFTPIKPAEKETAAPTPEPSTVPTDMAVQYDLQLGATVYLGTDEYEIYSFDDSRVVLRDVNVPLFTKEMPRGEFNRKLRENRLNDGLIQADDSAPEPQPEPETNKDVGKRYEIDGRQFIVESVDKDADEIKLRDITFQNGVGFPIFRSEPLDFIRQYTPIEEKPPELPAEKEESLTPSWEQAKRRSRTQAFDPHPEIPMSERHNYRITDDNLGHGGAKTKFRGNVEAIKTLQAIELENRLATPEEQEILARYVGWGGLPQAFDPENTSWTNEFAELQATLSPNEYESARSSTLNAHYTSPTVIKAIYKSVENMGFKTGNVLDMFMQRLIQFNYFRDFLPLAG